MVDGKKDLEKLRDKILELVKRKVTKSNVLTH